MTSFLQKPIRYQFRALLCSLMVIGLVLAAVCYGVIDGLMTRNATTYAQSTADQFDSEIEALFRRVDGLFSSLLFDPNIEQLMAAPYTERTQGYLNALRMQFMSYSLMNSDLAEIALVTSEMSWSSYFDAATLRAFSDDLQGEYESHCFGLRESPLIAHSGTGKFLMFGHNVYGLHDPALYGDYLGSVILAINLGRSSVMLPPADRSPTFFLLMDSAGAVFSFNSTESDYSRLMAQAVEAAGSDWFLEPTLELEDYLIYTSPLTGTELRVISAMDRHELNRDVMQSTLLLLGVTTLAILLVVLLMRAILRSMIKPLHQLWRSIEDARSAPLDAERAPLHLQGCAEIVGVSESFNELFATQARLSAELQSATVTLYETKLGLKQAELDFLRSQINPHFLYNTLGAIQSLAVERGVQEIGDVAGALGKLFRYNITGAATVPLSQELEYTHAYLTIQQQRFRLNVIESIRENAAAVPVMKLLLQPIVENAVYHGIEAKAGAGTLYLGARVEGGELILSVYDDGVGMAPDKLEALRKKLNAPSIEHTGEHIGLMNVQHRLRLHYGSSCGLQLDSTPNMGTQVTVHIPLQGKG